MPPLARLDSPGVLHHVIIRGIERRFFFKDDQDRENFIETNFANVRQYHMGSYLNIWQLLMNSSSYYISHYFFNLIISITQTSFELFMPTDNSSRMSSILSNNYILERSYDLKPKWFRHEKKIRVILIICQMLRHDPLHFYYDLFGFGQQPVKTRHFFYSRKCRPNSMVTFIWRRQWQSVNWKKKWYMRRLVVF